MRASAMIAGVLGAMVGYGASVMFPSRAAERPPRDDAAPANGASDRWSDCLARLDAIDARFVTLAAPAPAPMRVAAEEPGAARLEERLAAIEAALANLASSPSGPALNREEMLRRPKDAAAIAHLYEVEHGKQPQMTDDHQGYTAERLYDRYGAPDVIEGTSDRTSTIQFWVYYDTRDDHGIYFKLQNGVVVQSWAYAR